MEHRRRVWQQVGFVAGAVAFVAIALWPLPLVPAVTLSASMAFMLPVATPPNALVYGTGHLTIGTMARAGFRMNLLGWAAIVGIILIGR